MQNENRSTHLKIIILWLVILLLSSFLLTVKETSDPVSIVVVPLAPKQGEPIIATFKLNNASSQPLFTSYQFYVNGELIKEGNATIAPHSDKVYQYAYSNPLQIGQQLNFLVKTKSEKGSYEHFLSTPPYPPQIWSSFVSFASFSTSVMSSMSTMTYYQSTFGADITLNVGFIFSAVLIILLIFLELTQAIIPGKAVSLGRLRVRFSTVTWILLIIFVGITYTKAIMIIAV